MAMSGRNKGEHKQEQNKDKAESLKQLTLKQATSVASEANTTRESDCKI